MTTSGIDSCKSPAKLRLEDLRIGRFCGVKELTFWFSVGSWNESAFCEVILWFFDLYPTELEPRFLGK